MNRKKPQEKPVNIYKRKLQQKMRENIIDKIEDDKRYYNDFNFSQIKLLPMDVRVNEIIDILSIILNEAFPISNGNFYKKMHRFLDDNPENPVLYAPEEWE